jgi:hypothetical protein
MEEKQYFLKTFLSVLLVTLFISCGNKETARLKMAVAEYGNERLIIEENRVTGPKFIDSLHFTSKGTVKYKFDLKQTNFYNLSVSGIQQIYLLLGPGDMVQIVEAESGIEILGSEESVKLNNLYERLFEVRDQLNQLENKYNSAIDASMKDSIADEYEKVMKGHHRYSLEFVLENLTSLVSLAALYQEYTPGSYVFGTRRDMQYFKIVSDSLNKYYPKHRHVLALKRNFKNMHESYQFNKIVSSADVVESSIPALSLPDKNGKEIPLLDLKERYVLLHFWLENDQLSDKLFPGINVLQKKYNKQGFEVYNVYIGKSIENWKKIIHFEEIEAWVNVADTAFPNSSTRGMYNVNSVPVNYLIDLEAKTILAKDIDANDLGIKLNKLLGI